MKTILITGGAGFFGLHLTRKALERGWRVRSIDIADLNEPELERRIEFIKGDICDMATVTRACLGVDAVIHNAALVPISRSARRFWQVNVEGSRAVLESCVKNRVAKVIYISTSSVYGVPKASPITEATPLAPFGDYGKSKAEGEALCRKYQDTLDISIIRPRTILGTGRLGILQILFDWVKQGKRFPIFGAGSNRFQLVSAPDLAEGCFLAVEKPCRNEDFNFGAKEFTTLRGDLEGLVGNAGTRTKIISLPEGLARAALRVLDILRLSPFVDYHYHILSADVWFATDKAERLLGWQPKYSNISMLTEAYRWYLAHEHEVQNSVGTTHRKRVKLGIIKLVKWLF
jgi:nucleoside-diphosphate-sugar epimerase